MLNCTVILVSGNAGSGKDTFCFGQKYVKFAFADYLKTIFEKRNKNLNIDIRDRTEKEKNRHLLVELGEELRRPNENVFTQIVYNKIKRLYDLGERTFIISDWRYDREYYFLKDRINKIIKVNIRRKDSIKDSDNIKEEHDLVVINDFESRQEFIDYSIEELSKYFINNK